MTDMEILRKAAELESRPVLPNYRVVGWEASQVGAARADLDRLVSEALVEQVKPAGGRRSTTWRLTATGQAMVTWYASEKERRRPEVDASEVLQALDLVVGYDDLKEQIAFSLEQHTRTHFLLEGPPACAKSVILEGVRRAVPEAHMAFGSSTSGPGLSDLLFEHQPQVLLLDEVDKMRNDTLSVLLGLMETGEVIETKSKKTRGITLDTMVLGACNATDRLAPEFLSRWLHLTFDPYTRDEFVEVCRISLARAEGCPEELGATIGAWIYDYGLGDIRRAGQVWRNMADATIEEARRLVNLMLNYRGDGRRKRRKEAPTARMEGL